MASHSATSSGLMAVPLEKIDQLNSAQHNTILNNKYRWSKYVTQIYTTPSRTSTFSPTHIYTHIFTCFVLGGPLVLSVSTSVFSWTQPTTLITIPWFRQTLFPSCQLLFSFFYYSETWDPNLTSLLRNVSWFQFSPWKISENEWTTGEQCYIF